jgi:hypothetical protein
MTGHQSPFNNGLIAAYKQYELLYDIDHPMYRESSATGQCWQLISESINVPGENSLFM